jgi:UDP-N-acetylmuramoylalanine--D-glutamate ligase
MRGGAPVGGARAGDERAPRRLEEWRGRVALVVGLARSGLAAARLLARHGAVVLGFDRKPRAELPGVDALEPLGVQLYLGSDDARALARAQVLVVSPGVPASAPVVAEADRLGLPSVSEVELAFQASRAPWAAITGTNGKSTTTALLGELLERAGRRPWVAGNIGNALSEGVEEVAADGVVVAEVSSFQLERTVTFRPRVGLLLNLTPDHLDRYPGVSEYAAAKARLFAFQEAADFAVLNADDPEVLRLAAGGRARALTFSRRGPVPSGAFAEGGAVWWAWEGRRERLLGADEIRIPGPHNLENSLAAVAACLALGVLESADGRRAVAAGLAEFPGLEHRIEPCGEVAGRRFYNDSKATNVDSMRQALLALPHPLTVIAGGRDKHGDFPGLAALAAERIDHLVLIGEAAAVIARAWPRLPQERATDLDDAVRRAWRATPAGGRVALSPGCASFDMFRDFEDRGRKFKAAVARLAEQVARGEVS